MGQKVKYNMALVIANILFGANFSFYVSLTEYYLNFQQIFMLQVTVAAAFLSHLRYSQSGRTRLPLRILARFLSWRYLSYTVGCICCFGERQRQAR